MIFIHFITGERKHQHHRKLRGCRPQCNLLQPSHYSLSSTPI